MVGGHGTSGAFGPVLEEVGLEGATTFCIAAATFGLVAGGLIGGPIGERLIQKKKLQKSESFDASPVATGKKKSSFENLASAAFQLIIAAGIGTVVLWLLSRIGLKFPIYIGAMIVASVMRNGSEFTGKFKVPMKEMNAMCGIFLNLFLGIAMLSLKLWLLSGLALPLMILLAGQTVFMIFYARYVVFSMMGRNYDAAVICGGICGLGLGATPTAMANMESICKQYGPSVNAFLIVPVVGGVILDFINSILIAFFINIIG
jgi:ESS family glutamate:Na+ symporter